MRTELTGLIDGSGRTQAIVVKQVNVVHETIEKTNAGIDCIMTDQTENIKRLNQRISVHQTEIIKLSNYVDINTSMGHLRGTDSTIMTVDKSDLLTTATGREYKRPPSRKPTAPPAPNTEDRASEIRRLDPSTVIHSEGVLNGTWAVGIKDFIKVCTNAQ